MVSALHGPVSLLLKPITSEEGNENVARRFGMGREDAGVALHFVSSKPVPAAWAPGRVGTSVALGERFSLS